MPQTKFYVFDLDGTIADCEHRVHFVSKGKTPDWDAFFRACSDDKPIQHVIDVLRALEAEGNRVEIWSARSEIVRMDTLAWLFHHGINPSLLKHMRPDKDFTKDTELKKRWLEEAKNAGRVPDVIFDDRQSVVDMWRANGIPCFQVTSSNWDKQTTSEKNIVPNAKTKQTLTLLVGPSGAGKSTFALKNYPASWIISTDQLREDLGEDRDVDVFAAVARLTKARLSCGLSVVIDATHLRRKTRMNHVSLAKDFPDVVVEYVVIDRPLETKKRHGSWRNEIFYDNRGANLPEQISLIERHDMMFKSQKKDILTGDGNKNTLIHNFIDPVTEA
jgi:predicted kinase